MKTDQNKHNHTNIKNNREDLLADIRNKMSPASHLISLVDRYMNGGISLEEADKLFILIKKQLPLSKESMRYLRELK